MYICRCIVSSVFINNDHKSEIPKYPYVVIIQGVMIGD